MSIFYFDYNVYAVFNFCKVKMLYKYVGSPNTILYNLCTAGRLDTLIVCDYFLDLIVDNKFFSHSSSADFLPCLVSNEPIDNLPIQNPLN